MNVEYQCKTCGAGNVMDTTTGLVPRCHACGIGAFWMFVRHGRQAKPKEPAIDILRRKFAGS